MPRMRPASEDELELLRHAVEASRHAYAPYSKFAVGAALRCEGGEIRLGVNVENASYGLTSCAERNAVFAAAGDGHRRFEAIAVHADAASGPPCGACRQVLAEFAPELTVIYRQGGEVVAAPLEELLPHRFEL
jgi:cytidine deaminase